MFYSIIHYLNKKYFFNILVNIQVIVEENLSQLFKNKMIFFKFNYLFYSGFLREQKPIPF
jgi:hypothetical protein